MMPGSYIKAWKDAAHSAVHYAVRTGQLVRAARCYRCRHLAQTEAHHHRGYEKESWLKVLWLCRQCHKAADFAERVGLSFNYVKPECFRDAPDAGR